MNRLAVSWGFAEVLPDKVTILAQTAERPEEINVQRAQEAKNKAEEQLLHPKPDTDYDAAMAALQRADVRLQVAARKGTAVAGNGLSASEDSRQGTTLVVPKKTSPKPYCGL